VVGVRSRGVGVQTQGGGVRRGLQALGLGTALGLAVKAVGDDFLRPLASDPAGAAQEEQ
jgi:hypothetical protein